MTRSEKAPPSCHCHILGAVWVFAGDKVGMALFVVQAKGGGISG